MDGILLVNKPQDYTSRDIVNIIGKKLGIKKIGHTGTLDPIATGVMVLCVGRATKMVELITAFQKEYIATVIFGSKTDTGDVTGNILEEMQVHIAKEEIERACKLMEKTYNQTVPIYSAVKINGRKLYEYARANENVTLPKREVTIYELECVSDPIYENGKTIVEIRAFVSKGTYIRSLIEDLAYTLDTVGTMQHLIRTKQGDYKIQDCNTLLDFENGTYRVHDVQKVLLHYPIVIVDSYLEKKIKNGCILENRYADPIILFQTKRGNNLALYQIYDKDITKMKPWKML